MRMVATSILQVAIDGRVGTCREGVQLAGVRHGH